MDRGELEDLDRETLVVKAQAAGIRRARILTRPELIDELLRNDPNSDEAQLRKSRGFFGKARDLVARVVERGLHLPDAADRIRVALGSQTTFPVPRTEPQAMPTVTLAEIYAAQGHSARAIETLRRVLAREPDHAAARALLARLTDEEYVAPPPPLPPEPAAYEDSITDDDDDDADADADAETIHGGGGVVAAFAPGGDDSAADDAKTIAMKGRIGLQVDATIAGPSYDSSEGAEFFLDPSSQENPTFVGHTTNGEAPSSTDEVFHDPTYAPTRELPRSAGPTYTFTSARDADVDAEAKTDVFPVMPERAATERAVTERAVTDRAGARPDPRREDVTVVLPGSRSAVAGDDEEEPDECIAIPLPRGDSGGRTYVRWRVSFAVIGSLLGSRPRGRFVVRAHIVTPAWDGPNTETRDRTIDPDSEEVVLEALPEPSVVRVAIGWLDGATFVPLAHSPALETARGRGLVIWTTKGVLPIAPSDPRAASIGRAVDASQRSARASQAHG